MAKNRGAYEVSEDEFSELISGRDDTLFLDYDSQTGVIKENGIDLDRSDEKFIGQTFIDNFIDSGKEIGWGRNDFTDHNYEITR